MTLQTLRSIHFGQVGAACKVELFGGDPYPPRATRGNTCVSMIYFIYLILYIQDVKMGYPPHAFFRSQKCFFGPRNLSLRQTKSEFWDLRYTKNIEALLLALPNMCCSYCYKTLVLFAAYLLPCFLAFCAFSFFILYHSTAIVIVVKFC